MANISILSRLVNGVQRQVDLSANTLVVQALSTGTNTLTDTILGRLISLQNGTDVNATYHTHNTIYYTQTQLGAHATAGGSGAKLIGDGNTYVNITPASTTVEDALLALDSAVGSAASAVDSTFRITNSSDATKKIAFSAAGITTGTTRTITMPDADVNLGLVGTALQANGTVTATADQNFGGFRLTGVGNAVSGTDAINLNQFQNFQAGVQWRPEANLYDNVDTVLPATTATLIDGVTVTAGMRVLFVNLATNNNQVYVATVAGSAITWTAALDNDRSSAAPVTGDCILILQGTSFSESAWNFNGTTFVQFNGAGQIQAGNGLSKTGNTLTVVAASGSAVAVSGSGVSVTVSTSGGIQVASSALSLLLADTTLSTSSSGVKVALSALSGLIVSSGLKVAIDGTTTTINGSGQITILNAGIKSSMIDTGVFDQSTLVGGSGTPVVVAFAPTVGRSNFIAGQTFSLNTTYAIRWGIPANGETAGRVYGADIATASFDLFWVIGVFNCSSSIAIAGTIPFVVERGELTLASGETPFSTSDIGKPAWLGSGGVVLANSALVTTSGSAATKLGIVKSTTVIDIAPQVMGVN